LDFFEHCACRRRTPGGSALPRQSDAANRIAGTTNNQT